MGFEKFTSRVFYGSLEYRLVHYPLTVGRRVRLPQELLKMGKGRRILRVYRLRSSAGEGD